MRGFKQRSFLLIMVVSCAVYLVGSFMYLGSITDKENLRSEFHQLDKSLDSLQLKMVAIEKYDLKEFLTLFEHKVNELKNVSSGVESYIRKKHNVSYRDVMTRLDDVLKLLRNKQVESAAAILDKQIYLVSTSSDHLIADISKKRKYAVISTVIYWFFVTLIIFYLVKRNEERFSEKLESFIDVIDKVGNEKISSSILENENSAFFPLVKSINCMTDRLMILLEKEKMSVEESHKAEKQKLKEMEEYEGRLVAILKNIGEGVIAVDNDGSVVLMNYVAEDMTGYTGSEGEFIGDVLILQNEDKGNKIQNPVLDVLQNPRYLELHGNHLLINKDGWLFQVSLIATPFYVDGEVVGAVAVIRDVSDSRNLEKTLMNAKKEAENASRDKSLFLANMSHEIRTPINGIIGMSELLMETDLDSTQDELVTILSSETQSLLNLVNNILDFSKLEAGKLDVEHIEFSLNSLTRSMMKSVAVSARKKGLDFYVYHDPDIPGNLYGDPDKLRQCVTNLLTNAVKFTSSGEIILNLKHLGTDKDRTKILIEIVDTGIGISKDKQAKVFDSFSQADASTTRKFGGTGLGLAIVKSLVELMGGKLGVESEVDSGSRFWIELSFHISDKKVFDENFEFNDTGVLVLAKTSKQAEITDKYFKSIGVDYEVVTLGENLEGLDSLEYDEKRKTVLIDMGKSKKEDFRDLDRIITDVRFKKLKKIILCYPDYVYDKNFMEARGVLGTVTKPVCRYSLISFLYAVTENLENEIFADYEDISDSATASEIDSEDSSILLVDDYPVNQTVALRHLIRSGYRVDIAENGEQAVEMYKSNEYDLVLMDVQMPIMDGFAATGHIREHEKTTGRRVPVIALTAHVGDNYREKCLEKEMDDYLSKPLRKISLLNMVKKWLTGREEKAVEGVVSSADTVINLERLYDEFDGDEEFAIETVNEFITQAISKLKQIDDYIGMGNFEQIKAEVHDIKGGARTIEAVKTADFALKLEDSAKDSDIVKCGEYFINLSDALSELKEFMDNHKA